MYTLIKHKNTNLILGSGLMVAVVGLLAYLFLFSVGGTFSTQSVPGFCKQYADELDIGECDALVDIYQATNGRTWVNRYGWMNHNVAISDRYGVHIEDGHVISLHLGSNNLVGNLPTTIGNLTHLESLYLYDNKIIGVLPVSLGDLQQLSHIYLFGNQISGPIPESLANLTNLDSFVINDNAYIGSIPPALVSLVKANILQVNGANTICGSQSSQDSNTLPEQGLCPNNAKCYLHLDCISGFCDSGICAQEEEHQAAEQEESSEGNPISEQLINSYDCSTQTDIPVSQCEALVQLYEDTNGDNRSNNDDWLVESPESRHGIGIINNAVRFIDLENNNLQGTIPQEIGNLSDLFRLNLSRNKLTNGLPPSINGLTKIAVIKLGYNNLTSIPQDFRWLTELQQLHLVENDLSGPVLENLLLPPSIIYLEMNGNNISGGFPSNVGELTKLKKLSVYDNIMTGPLPNDIGLLENLELLFLHNNSFGGILPQSLGNLNKLTSLYLSNNSFTGPLPQSLGELESLTQFLFDINSYVGVVPDFFIQNLQLNTIRIKDNDICGDIPTELISKVNITQQEISGLCPLNAQCNTTNDCETGLTCIARKCSDGSLPNTAPTIEFLSPTAQSMHVVDQDITVTVRAQDAEQNLNKLVCAGQDGQQFVVADYNPTQDSVDEIFTFQVSTEGEYTIGCTALDAAGENTNAQMKIQIVGSTNIPQVKFTSPGNGQTFTEGETIDFIIAHDNLADSPTLYYLKLLQGSNTIRTISPVQESSWPYTIQHTINSIGSYTFDVQINYLDENNVSQAPITDSVTIQTINAPLTIQLTKPVNSQDFLEGDTILLEAGVQGNATVGNVKFYVDGQFAANGVLNTTNNTYQASWVADNAGSIPIYAQVTDTQGETSSSAVIYILVGSTTCQPGTYRNNNSQSCVQCQAGYYCEGGQYGTQTQCPIHMTSLPGSQTIDDCTYSYNCATNTHSSIPASECDALLEFYFATNGGNWFQDTNWLNESTGPGQWYGVTVENGAVVELELDYNNVSGQLPSLLSDLTQLRKLSLRTNALNGPIPSELGDISSLVELNLWTNNFNGNIPTSFQNLSQLETLKLGQNQLVGTLPDLSVLPNLKYIDVSENQLVGNIPDFLGSIINLEYLGLQRNNFDGTFPTNRGNLSQLGQVFIQHNNLVGAIPANYANIALGQYDNFFANGSNTICGNIPQGIDIVDVNGTEQSLCPSGTSCNQAQDCESNSCTNMICD